MSDRYDPFSEIEELIERMSGDFEDLGGGLPGGGGVDVDVADHGDEVVVTADLPGYDASDIEVTVQDRTLSLSADTEETTEVGEPDEYYRRERRRQSVSRQVRLPVAVDESGASATHRNGVLTVRLPKATATDEGHSIDVS